MRLPLIATLVLLFFAIAIDYYLWRRIKKVSRRKLWLRIHVVVSIIFNVGLLLVICLPKRRGADAGLELIMWALYTYFSVYIPKFLFVIFDAIAALPLLWRRKRWKWLSISGIVIAVAVFLIMWWGALVNRYSIDVRNVDVTVADLPEAFDGYTIAQISDFHVGTFGTDTTFVSKVIDKVNSLSPDVVAFTGDIVNRRSSELRPFVSPLSRMHARDGVLSILGNHDYGDYYSWDTPEAKAENMKELLDMQAEMDWHMLNNATSFIYRGNDSIAIIGVENVGDPPFTVYGDLDMAYETLDDPTVKILLSHNPAHWIEDIKDSPDKNIALTLSGHTHAMQMSAFGVSPAALRYPTWGGLYEDEDGHQLYVNIGLGEVAIPARIGATPEITLITLRRK